MVGCDNDDVSVYLLFILFIPLVKYVATTINVWHLLLFLTGCLTFALLSCLFLFLLFFLPFFLFHQCSMQWFHFECVGLKVKPKGRYYIQISSIATLVYSTQLVVFVSVDLDEDVFDFSYLSLSFSVLSRLHFYLCSYLFVSVLLYLGKWYCDNCRAQGFSA